MAALLLATIIMVLITIKGKDSYDIARDFQTTFAAFVAAAAALIAYRGAMAKVSLDRDIHNRMQAGTRLGLYLRLQSQLERLIKEAQSNADDLDRLRKETPDGPILRIVWEPDATAFQGYDELEEAWSRLELLPRDAFRHLDAVRFSLAELKDIFDKHKGKKEIPRIVVGMYSLRCKTIVRRGSALLELNIAAIDRAAELM